MTAALKYKEMQNMEIIRVGGETHIRELFGRKALKLAKESDPAGKFIDVMQTTLMKKNEGKRFYI